MCLRGELRACFVRLGCLQPQAVSEAPNSLYYSTPPPTGLRFFRVMYAKRLTDAPLEFRVQLSAQGRRPIALIVALIAQACSLTAFNPEHARLVWSSDTQELRTHTWAIVTIEDSGPTSAMDHKIPASVNLLLMTAIPYGTIHTTLPKFLGMQALDHRQWQ